MAIVLKVNGSASGSDRLFASVGGKRFPAPVSITNTGPAAAEVELRVEAGPTVTIHLAEWRFELPPRGTAETTIEAGAPSSRTGDTVLQAIVDGHVAAEFRLTIVSPARESVFHNLVPGSS
ncbi:MAG TPA: hypothetical protein VFA54_12375 [Bryobacterales bacterium]|jgi:hypothetical protein|nr:hypothetical protein [Bryobacterales bacterium]